MVWLINAYCNGITNPPTHKVYKTSNKFFFNIDFNQYEIIVNHFYSLNNFVLKGGNKIMNTFTIVVHIANVYIIKDAETNLYT